MDKSLNIHLIFMDSANVAREYSVTRPRLNKISADLKPIERFKDGKAGFNYHLIANYLEKVKYKEEIERPAYDYNYNLTKVRSATKKGRFNL